MAAQSESNASLVADGLCTIAEVGQFTRLGRSTIYSLMETGVLAYVKLGARRLVPRRAMVTLAANGLVGGTKVSAKS